MRLLTTFLLFSCSSFLIGQSFPERPNEYSSDSLRIGEWITFYDSLGNEIQRESFNISHYCLMEIQQGKPLGQIECFYENGIRSWTGRMTSIDPEIKQGRALGYHKNGALANKAFYENDTLQGTYTSYYDNGILEAEGEMVNGKKIGEWTFFYENGNPIGTIGHVDGKEVGDVTIYYDNGNINSKGTIGNDLSQGIWEVYFENGSLANKGNYIDGKRNGKWVYYYENGKEKEVGFYKNDTENGAVSYYFENGDLKSRGNYEKGLKDGKWEFYHENGQLSSAGIIRKGLYQGPWLYYYSNGQKESEGSYTDDENDGLWSYYYENGQFNRKVHYNNGVENGPIIYYYDNGVVNAKGDYIDGSKNGKWKYYLRNGDLQGIENYENGTLHGYKEFRNTDGKLVNRGQFKNGKQDGTWEFFYENGQLSSFETYENGVSQGSAISYYEDGSIRREGEYLNDVREGLWKFYHSNGELSAIGDYKEGKSTGIWKYYFDNGTKKSEGKEYADQKYGDWTYYRRNGTLKSKEFYENGLAHGELIFYDTLGNVRSRELYVNGIAQTFSTFYDSANNLATNGQFELAEQILELADKAYYEAFEKDGLKKSDLYELYASVYRKKGEYKKAIKYIKKALNHVRKFKSDTSVWYTSTLDDLADIYTDMKDHEQANETYEIILRNIKERPAGMLSSEYANAVRYHAITLMNLQRHDEAVANLKEDLKFRSTVPNQSKQIAATYANIIDGLYPKLSISLDTTIRNSIAFHEQNDLTDRWSYAASQYFKGLVHRDKNELDSAYASFNEVIKTNSIMRDTLNAQFANALLHLGSYHYNRLEYDQSRAFYYRLAALTKNERIKNSWIYTSALASISNQYWVDGDYQKTLACSQLLLDISKPKSDTLRIGKAYSSIAIVYDNFGIDYIKKAQENHIKSIQELSKYEEYNTYYVDANLHYANHLDQHNLEDEQYDLLLKVKNYIHSFEEVDSLQLYRTYQHLASNFYHRYSYDSAIFYAQKITDNLKLKPGKNLQQYLVAYRIIGDVYSDKNEYEIAGRYYLSSLSETEKFLGMENEFYVIALQAVADNFSNQYNHSSAIQYYAQAIEIQESLYGNETVLETRIDYAEELISLEKYDSALRQLDQIQNAYIDRDQVYTDKYLLCLRMKSRAFERLKNMKNAEDLLLEGLNIAEKIYDFNNPSFVSYIRRVGEFYLRNDEVDLAYQYIAPAFETIEKEFGDQMIIYAWYAETMSRVLLSMDDYANAVNLLEKASAIYLEEIGEGEDYRDVQYSLGELFAQLGQYEKSIEALEKSRKSVVNEFGRYSLAYTGDTKKIALTYLLWDKDQEALHELNTVTNLYDSMGVDRSYYASTFNQLGWAFYDLDSLEKSKKYYEMSIQIADSAWGKESGASMTYRSNLAFYYLKRKEYEQAEKLWLASKKESFNSELDKVRWLDNLAMLYTGWGKLATAQTYWKEINELLLAKIKGDFPLLSESGKAAFWDAWKEDFEIFNTYALKAYLQGDGKALGQMYDNQLQTKSLLLNSTTKERKRILNSGSKELLGIYRRYISLKEDLAKYYGYSAQELNEQDISIETLEDRAESLEKALSINSEQTKSARKVRNLSWKNIQRTLLPDEAAIEIIRFRYYDNVKSDSVIYAALILTSNTGSQPILEILPNGSFLEDKAIKAYRTAMKYKVNDDRSYGAFWSKIDKHLLGIKAVYLSSDGVYHQLNVATLKDQQGHFINEKYDTRLVSSTRTISEVKQRNRSNSSNTAYIFGNPKFDLSHTLIQSDLKDRGITSTSSYTRATNLDDFSFYELPGTKVETETLNDVLNKHNWTTNLYLGENALEEEMKRVDNPTILHVATHGFFLDQPDENSSEIQLGVQVEASKKNPLLRSGLLMTGATQTAKGEQNNSIENGIFTAYEAMNLDLSSTELVILSACETGLGEIKNGEGVFGLQRAFQIAGAKSILMSLWKVDDDATQLLMTSFYDAWLNGADEVDALHQAQKIVKGEYPHPNYWGAFVLVGG